MKEDDAQAKSESFVAALVAPYLAAGRDGDAFQDTVRREGDEEDGVSLQDITCEDYGPAPANERS